MVHTTNFNGRTGCAVAQPQINRRGALTARSRRRNLSEVRLGRSVRRAGNQFVFALSIGQLLRLGKIELSGARTTTVRGLGYDLGQHPASTDAHVRAERTRIDLWIAFSAGHLLRSRT